MPAEIRKATVNDIDSITRIYDAVHEAEESGAQTIGWIKGVYPVRDTAEQAVARGDMYVLESDGTIYGSAVINNIQVEAYAKGRWMYETPDDKVCVLHTLVIDPKAAQKGYGRKFIDYYEEYAKMHSFSELRIDTNEKNKVARAMYARLGYKEIGTVPTVFNGIPDVNLILLEKRI
ncbi:MAG: GNAT family N-acetyltransferase [Lachnospiraceae bacterium]|nr:GNAT family N-acetyltransferase [Lachnospiraceae bacterium]